MQSTVDDVQGRFKAFKQNGEYSSSSMDDLEISLKICGTQDNRRNPRLLDGRGR